MCSHDFCFWVGPEDATRRADNFLAGRLDLPRARISTSIKGGHVLRNGFPIRKPGETIARGDRLSGSVLLRPDLSHPPQPQTIPVPVAYEDEHTIVIDKPAGLVVHPTEDYPSGTLVNAVLGRGCTLAVGSAPERPGVVHRLDRDTSGLIVLAKSKLAMSSLSQQIASREVTRTYRCLVVGIPPQREGVVDAPLGRHPRHRHKISVVPDGKPARTHWRWLQVVRGNKSLLEVQLETGRTHQIRVHMAHIGYPVVGDPVYGRPNSDISRQWLHATELSFRHPQEERWIRLVSAIPEDLSRLL